MGADCCSPTCCSSANNGDISFERRSSVSIASNPKVSLPTTDSTDSLTVLTGQNKNWWYWVRFAAFVASPFIARQLGIFVGKRLASRAFLR